MGLSTSSIAMLLFAVIVLYGGMLYFILVVKSIHLIDYIPISRDRLDNLIKANMKIKGIIAVSLVVLVLIPILGGGVDIEKIESRGANKYLIKFDEKSEILYKIDGHTEEGKTTDEKMIINKTNITKILFVLRWEESGVEATQNDEFKLSIFPPENISSNLTDANYTPSSSEKSSNGEISIEVQLNSTSNETKIRADTSAEVIELFTSLFGIGEWEVEVEAVDCPPDSYIPFAPDPDTGNDWTLEITVYYYIGNVTEIKETIL